MPDWLLVSQDYQPQKDRERFLKKSIGVFLGVLSLGRPGIQSRQAKDRFHPGLKVIACLATILLVSLSFSPAYLYLNVTLLFVMLAFLPAARILDVLETVLAAAVFSAFILLPSFFLGYTRSSAMIFGKSLVTVAFVKLLSVTTPWNSIFGAFRTFRIPGVFILVLDITLKYISILGEIALDMLYALKLRSVGKNPDKIQALSGIAGMLFLKSKEMSREVWWSMECRGFTGEYRNRRKQRFSMHDALLVLAVTGLAATSLFFSGASR